MMSYIGTSSSIKIYFKRDANTNGGYKTPNEVLLFRLYQNILLVNKYSCIRIVLFGLVASIFSNFYITIM